MGNHPPSRQRRLRLQYWLSALWRSAAGRSGSPHGVVTGSCSSPNLRTLESSSDCAGLPRIHFHDLRHTGNQLAADAGASLRELMDRMGHSTARAATPAHLGPSPQLPATAATSQAMMS